MTNTAIRIGMSLAALTFAAAVNAGEALPVQDGFWLCQNTRSAATETLYVSKLFEANADRGAVYAAYQAMLAEKYGITGQVSCSMAYKAPGIQEKLTGDNERWFQQVRAAGAKVIETGWQFGGAATAPSAAAPVANTTTAAAPKTYQCWMNSPAGYFMTPGFESSKEYAALSTDWRDYILKAHPPKGGVQIRCMELNAQTAATNLAQPGRKRVDWKE